MTAALLIGLVGGAFNGVLVSLHWQPGGYTASPLLGTPQGLAELEAGAGARATYFLMTGSVFYNLSSSEGEETGLADLDNSSVAEVVRPGYGTDDEILRPSAVVVATRGA